MRNLLLLTTLLWMGAFTSYSYAQDKRIQIENIFAVSEATAPTAYVAIKYQNMGSFITHNERSDSSNFSALNEQSKIMMHIKGVQLSKEFLADEYISFSILGQIGHFAGSDEDNLAYSEKGSGFQYGGGLGINLNGSGYRMRIQPFISSQYIVLDSDYEVNYQNASVNDITRLFYKTHETALQHSLGVRITDPKSNLMSFFSVDYIQSLNQSEEVSGSRNGSEFNINENGQVETRPLSLTIGFGFMF